MILLVSLVLLTLGAWVLTVYQAQTMDMPMGVAVRGMVDGEVPPAGEDTMAAGHGMVMDDSSPGSLANASMAGMSGTGWTWDALLAFVIAWAVMMAAMMFPSVVPTWIFALGYLGLWTAIGVVTWALIQLASDLATRMSVMGRETWAPSALGTILILAGIYQFTPLKRVCLRQCQSPVGFVMSHWRDGPTGALRMGVVHGAYCLGCCWALIAVLVKTGVMSLAGMLLLTLIVAVEKLLPLGPRAPQVIGAALVTLGAVVAAGASTLPWTA